MVDTDGRRKIGRSEVCGLLLLVGAVTLMMWPGGQSASEMPVPLGRAMPPLMAAVAAAAAVPEPSALVLALSALAFGYRRRVV